MVKYYRKKYSRRNYRRKTLSTSRIFSKTGAKSQAKQIYALKRSVSSLKKRFKPEIYTNQLSSVFTKTFTNATLSDSFWKGYYAWPSDGAGEGQKRGDKIYVKSLQFNFTFEYYNNSDTAYHNSESSGCPVRIIVLKSKNPIDPNSHGNLSDILQYSGYSGAEYTQRAVSPYVHGITDQFKIMYNKVFYMNPTQNQKALRIFLKPGLIQWETSGIVNHVFVYVCPCGLHSDLNFTETIQMTMSGKIAYLDY